MSLRSWSLGRGLQGFAPHIRICWFIICLLLTSETATELDNTVEHIIGNRNDLEGLQANNFRIVSHGFPIAAHVSPISSLDIPMLS